MKFSDAIKLAFSNLKKRKGRTFLTALAVAIGTTLVLTMVGLGTTGQKYLIDEINRHSSVKKVSVNPVKYMSTEEMMNLEDGANIRESKFKKIDKETLAKISKNDKVNYLTASIYGQLSEINLEGKTIKKRMTMIGYDLDYSLFCEDEVKPLKDKDNTFKTVLAGRSLNKGDKDVVVISESYLNEMGIKDYYSVVGKKMTLTLSSSSDGNKLKPLTREVTVVGVMNKEMEKYTGKLVSPMEIAALFKGYADFDTDSFKNKGFNNVTVFAKDTKDVTKLSDDIKNMGYLYNSNQSVVDQINDAFAVIKGILSVLGIIVLIVAAIGIINTMIMSIYERKKSIGIMKSLGASNANIKGIFVVESASIGLIGGVMGVFFSFVNGIIIEGALKMFLKTKGSLDNALNFYMPSWLIWGTLVFAILLALVSGVYPASKAAKLDPIEALNSK